MTLIVDFNMRSAGGLIPALLAAGQSRRLQPGARVIAADGEGTECQAVVTEIAPTGRYALLAPVGGTWQQNSSVRPSAQDLFV